MSLLTNISATLNARSGPGWLNELLQPLSTSISPFGSFSYSENLFRLWAKAEIEMILWKREDLDFYAVEGTIEELPDL